MTDRPRCLLVIPRTFYAFARTLEQELLALGYAVTVANDEYPANRLGKAMGKLDLGLVRWLTRRAFATKFLNGPRWELTIICKGRGVGAALAQDLRRCSKRVVGYHWDAIAYDRATIRWTRDVDRVSTFDYRDAAEHGWPLVELFSTLPAPDPMPPLRYNVSAILRNHSRRLDYVDRVIGTLGDGGSFVYIFERSRLLCLARALLAPRLYWRWRHRIFFTSLPYSEYIETLATSDFTIDFAHPKQTGTTIRCFEALATGAKIITNNPFTAQSRHFGKHNVIVFNGGVDDDSLRAAVASFAGKRPALARRTPREFLADVIAD